MGGEGDITTEGNTSNTKAGLTLAGWAIFPECRLNLKVVLQPKNNSFFFGFQNYVNQTLTGPSFKILFSLKPLFCMYNKLHLHTEILS